MQAFESYVRKVIRRLGRAYPKVKCALNYKTPEQLLIATILSAQCTDERVNQVTEVLFEACPDCDSLSQLPLAKIENYIYSTGFYKNKAKNLKACCSILVEKYGGRVPQTLEELVKLPGVGRKTGNVVLGNAFGVPSGIVVDTHVGRISYRLGLVESKNPVSIERDLLQIIPKKHWIMFSHWLIALGRGPCKARKAKCEDCFLDPICKKQGL